MACDVHYAQLEEAFIGSVNDMHLPLVLPPLQDCDDECVLAGAFKNVGREMYSIT